MRASRVEGTRTVRRWEAMSDILLQMSDIRQYSIFKGQIWRLFLWKRSHIRHAHQRSLREGDVEQGRASSDSRAEADFLH